jgi:hypothetical protein
MEIASYEVVGSGRVWRVKHDGEPIGSYQTKEAASRQPLQLLHWPFAKGTRSSFQYPGVVSNPGRYAPRCSSSSAAPLRSRDNVAKLL